MNSTPAQPKPPVGAIAAGIVLSVVILLLWALQLVTVASLGQSDPAGNGLAQAYAAIQMIVLWLLLMVLTILAGARGVAPRAAKIAALVIVPASGLVTSAAAGLLSRPFVSPFLWPIVIPALVPPLIVMWCLFALSAARLRAGTIRIVGGALLAMAVAVCVSIWPLSHMRKAVDDQEAARLQQYDTDLARVAANAPLWEWTPFLDTRDGTKQQKVLDDIRKLDQRQVQAEAMLKRGDFPLRYLAFFDLDPTPALCAKARALLGKRAESLMLDSAKRQPYAAIADQVSAALAAMGWLVGYGCSCDAESTAWETMAKAYTDPLYDVHRLAELRDPKQLGRTARERPERFSMLNAQSHLRGWLRFVDEAGLQAQALAGARQVGSRTADAVEILRDKYDEESRWKLQRFLVRLDLEATQPLCMNALSELHAQFAKIYRPAPADEPRPYSELLQRLGTSEQLPNLIWLSRHGCAAGPELDEAIALVKAYQDSADRAKMLATLTALRSAR
ncbi:hypothetical protein [Bradyrhizobium sp. AUGA SZCCT0182]|uniref:hypothetical protein n=1 Tax=Bradyrhizobium sp. AUGA SZCCT0182 TaxID=2807667 RepID=UPI001BA9C4E3|nr:hypothetical protein [Bradyrhizobium sp. AUGA SZCCT0182]MBR1233522.1 hypothetical protein [Bradyrhizobium sp. AUGA SZCCT0182]